MSNSGRFSFPQFALISWFTKRSDLLDKSTQLKLLSGPFSSKPALIALGLNTLLICSVALYRNPTLLFLIWLCADVLIWVVRWSVLHRCNNLNKPPLTYATDLSLVLGLIWAAEIGIGTAACVISGDPILQVLACTSTVSMNGAIAMRNQGIPRYAFAQILLTDIPMKVSTLLQSEPMLRIFILQAPMYLIGLWVLLNHLYANLTSAYVAEAQSAHNAKHDSLTGLLNRSGVFCLLNGLLDTASQRQSTVGVLYLDLDGFKSINDRCGHAKGDEALIVLSNVLKNSIRVSDSAARIGGDEFIVVLKGASEASASLIAGRIIATLEGYCQTVESFKGLSVSVGIALAEPEQLTTATSILHRADVALYQAKMQGKRCYRYAL